MSSLVTRSAPEFIVPAVLPDDTVRQNFSSKELEGKYWVLFFYPYDFSVVCPTELLALDERLEEFHARECEVLAISVDSHYTHRAWKNAAEDSGGIGPVRYPLLSDLTKEVSRAYGVLWDQSVSLRATFLVDRKGIIRHATVNDLDLGRNVGEILRTLDAVRHVDETGELCPANWHGKEGKGKPLGGIRKKVQTFDLSSR